MKKALLYTALAAIAAAACTTTEYLDVDNLDPELVINAQMTIDEDVHTIHLSSSSRSKVSPVPEGKVTVKINSGEPFAATWQAPEEGYEEFSSSKFVFSDKLNPGDVVEVNATSGSLSAGATITVPAAPNLLGVEFTQNVKHASSSSDSMFGGGEYYTYWPYAEPNPYPGNAWHEVKVKFADEPGVDNFYRVTVYLETILTTDEGTEVSLGHLHLDTSSEPALASGSSDGGLIDQLTEDSNYYCVFNDKVFDGKEYTLNLYFQEEEIMYSRKYHNLEGGYYDEETWMWVEPEMPEGWSYKTNILVRLYSISHYQYIYLKAMDLNDLAILFSEPVSIPSNVEGGMGFVNVDSCKEFRTELL